MSQYITYIKSILLALAFLGGTAAGLWLLSLQIGSLGASLHDAIQVVSDHERFTEEYNSLATLLETTQAEREQLKMFILQDEHDTIKLLSEIDQLAAEKKVALNTSRLDTIETKDTFNQLAATFQIVGPEVSVMQMIEALESLPYHSDVTSLSATRRVSEETGFEEMSVNISLLLSIQKHD